MKVTTGSHGNRAGTPLAGGSANQLSCDQMVVGDHHNWIG